MVNAFIRMKVNSQVVTVCIHKDITVLHRRFWRRERILCTGSPSSLIVGTKYGNEVNSS